MEVTGTLIAVMPEQTGQGKTGNTWRKREFVIETKGQYPKKICMEAWGDTVGFVPDTLGAEIKASIDIESREHNGRWYTGVKAFKIESDTPRQNTSQGNNNAAQPQTNAIVSDDTLPF